MIYTGSILGIEPPPDDGEEFDYEEYDRIDRDIPDYFGPV